MEEVADFAECVTVVSSALQVVVVVVCASLAETRMEMKPAEVEWPRIYTTVEDLRGAILERMIPILHPDGQVNELLVKNVFEVQQALVDALVDMEKGMMSVYGPFEILKGLWRASNLRKIDGEFGRLKGCALLVVQSGSIAEHSKELESIRKSLENLDLNALSARDTFKSFI